MTVDRYTNKDALGAVRELVAKWRHQEPTCSALASQNRKDAFRRCANELEAALAQAPAMRVTDEMVNRAMDGSFHGRTIFDALNESSDYGWELMRAALEAALGQEKEKENE